MTKTQQRSIRSRVSIAGHPLHPTMIHFPIAALMGLVASDLGYLFSGDEFWARASLWLVGVGALGGWFASVAGIIDLVVVKGIRRLITGWCHSIVAVMLLSMATLNWFSRLDAPTDMLPWGLVMSLVTAALIALAGILGGQLVYEHAVGVEVEE